MPTLRKCIAMISAPGGLRKRDLKAPLTVSLSHGKEEQSSSAKPHSDRVRIHISITQGRDTKKGRQRDKSKLNCGTSKSIQQNPAFRGLKAELNSVALSFSVHQETDSSSPKTFLEVRPSTNKDSFPN